MINNAFNAQRAETNICARRGGRTVGLIRQVVCASPAYLKRRGAPKTPADLAKHDCVVHESSSGSSSWEFATDKTIQTIHVPSRLAVNLVRRPLPLRLPEPELPCIVVPHQGLAEIAFAGDSAGRVCEPTPFSVSIIYPSQRQVPLKLRAFLDFAVPRLRKRLGYENT